MIYLMSQNDKLFLSTDYSIGKMIDCTPGYLYERVCDGEDIIEETPIHCIYWLSGAQTIKLFYNDHIIVDNREYVQYLG